MYQQSILTYRQFRFLKLALLLCFSALALYFWDDSTPRNGGTFWGYTLGTVGSFLILLLMWLGIRKRAYHSHWGTVQGWVSAHIYLGLVLVLIVTLHAGFQFGINIHTLAYVFMLLVVGSGFYGVYAYLRYPQALSRSNAGMTRAQIQREIAELHQECLLLSESLNTEIQHQLNRTMATTQVGGSVWQQLTPFTPYTSWWQRFQRRTTIQAHSEEKIEHPVYDALMYTVADHMAHENDDALRDIMRRILELWGRRNALLKRLRDTVRYQTLMELWLYFHIPLSFALLATLIAHIVSVFLYW
jgi:hypothetical protein